MPGLFLNFGESLIKWVGILLKDFSAVINHCGNISQRFDVACGCRQGDPIASFLFILCVEILALRLRSDKDVKGFKFLNFEHLLEMYADDISIFLDGNEQNLRNVLQIFQDFYKLSGLKINVGKTNAVWFGNKSDCNQKLCHDMGLTQ